MSRKTSALAWLFASTSTVMPAAAKAHGAFPEPVDVLTRASAPLEVVLATNFGVLVSRDAGATWEWICEDAFGSFRVSRYALGPDGTIFVASVDGLFAGNLSTCGFARASGAIAGHDVTDVAVDAVDPQHVYAVGVAPTDGGTGTTSVAFESIDRGATFAILPGFPQDFAAIPAAMRVAADGRSIYVLGTMEISTLPSPRMAIRLGGAAGFSLIDLSALAPNNLTRIQIDPTDSRHVFFVASGAQEDVLYESTAAGASPIERLRIADYFLGLAFGSTAQTLFVGARDAQKLFRSDDGGKSFSTIVGTPRFACLATQGNVLWGCTNWEADTYAMGRSRDRGTTWGGALRFEDVPDRIASCLTGGCQSSLEWLCSKVCSGAVDAGGFPGLEIGRESPEARDAASDSPVDGEPDTDVPDSAREPPRDDDGCFCAAALSAGGGAAEFLGGIAFLFLHLCRQRRRGSP